MTVASTRVGRDGNGRWHWEITYPSPYCNGDYTLTGQTFTRRGARHQMARALWSLRRRWASGDIQWEGT